MLIEQRAKDRESAQKQIEAEIQAREQNKEMREKYKQEIFSQIEKDRTEFKEKMNNVI